MPPGDGGMPSAQLAVTSNLASDEDGGECRLINEQAMTSATHSKIEPVVLKADGPDHLLIVWSDGRRSVFTWGFLREHCPSVVPYRSRKAKTTADGPEATGSSAAAPASMEPVGRYAYHITWNDGHTSGIYSFEHLLALAQSKALKKEYQRCRRTNQPRV